MVRIHSAESLRFPEEGSSTQGQSGPNVRPKGVADGHPVNIPELPERRYHDGGTQEAIPAYDWMCRFRHVGGAIRQIRWLAFPEVPWRDRKVAKRVMPRCQEKPLRSRSGTRTANRHR